MAKRILLAALCFFFYFFCKASCSPDSFHLQTKLPLCAFACVWARMGGPLMDRRIFFFDHKPTSTQQPNIDSRVCDEVTAVTRTDLRPPVVIRD